MLRVNSRIFNIYRNRFAMEPPTPKRRVEARRIRRQRIAWAMAVGGWLVLSPGAVLAGGQASIIDFELREISGSTVRTPEYETSLNAPAGREEWFRLQTEYRTDAAWLDDLTFTYYVLFRPDPRDAAIELDPARPYVLLRGHVTYINVPEGRHVSVMFIHPHSLARFGEVGRIAVVVTHRGRPVAFASEPSGPPGWWERLSPVDGQIFNRQHTPFAMALSDDYEMIQTK